MTITIAEPITHGIIGVLGVDLGVLFTLLLMLCQIISSGFFAMEFIFGFLGAKDKSMIKDLSILLISPLTYVSFLFLSSISTARINSAISHLGVQLQE